MPEATNTPSTAVRVVRRRRAAPAQVGAVVRTPKLTPATEDIIAEVQAKASGQRAEISRRLRELVTIVQAQHRDRADELVPIGMQMDRPMLDDFIEIGRRMLAGRSRA